MLKFYSVRSTMRNGVAALFLLAGSSMWAADYGQPSNIQDGNILHCFNWSMAQVKEELPNIAAAGFGAVQLSPLQRNVSTSSSWYDAYRPWDFCFVESALGSKAELMDLCATADQYGVKIVVDVVLTM